MKNSLLIAIAMFILISCSAEVGSERWCNNLDSKAKGDWTMNEAKDYAKHCLFKTGQ
ncbi:MAG: DUF3012 domain-containing protein [Gammaproteobacteria bacterium]|nr:DUF3012 domain-containing protein [Gammaproteobacteria bacterium]